MAKTPKPHPPVAAQLRPVPPQRPALPPAPPRAPPARPRPNLAAAGLAIAGPVPIPAEYPPGSGGFRYWNAAEILVRAAMVWRIAAERPWHWHGVAILPVRLDPGAGARPGCNRAGYDRAGYDRAGLCFTAGPAGAEAPDLLCRALGHAVLDALRPDLWDAAAAEVGAFHDGFAAVTAVLAALELPQRRAAVLAGAAVAPEDGGLVAAFLDMLALLRRAESGLRGRTADAALLGAARKAARLMVTAVRRVPATPNFLAQFAAELVLAAAVQEGPALAASLRAALAARCLLAPGSAAHGYDPHEAEDGSEIPAGLPVALAAVAIDGAPLGLARPLRLRPAAQPPLLAAASCDAEGAPRDPSHPATAARDFAAGLLRRGLVDLPRMRPGRDATHRLVDDGRTLLLQRVRFVCR